MRHRIVKAIAVLLGVQTSISSVSRRKVQGQRARLIPMDGPISYLTPDRRLLGDARSKQLIARKPIRGAHKQPRLLLRSLKLGAIIALSVYVTEIVVAAELYTAYGVGIIKSPTPTANCAYFELVGVAQADPISPSNPWFAIPATQNGFAEVYASLVAAKIAGTTVSVLTTGALAGGSCGTFAGVDSVQIAP